MFLAMISSTVCARAAGAQRTAQPSPSSVASLRAPRPAETVSTNRFIASGLSCAPLDPGARRITAVEQAAMSSPYSSAIDSNFLNAFGTRPPEEQDPLPRLLWRMDEAQHTLVSAQNS